MFWQIKTTVPLMSFIDRDSLKEEPIQMQLSSYSVRK